MAAATSTSMPMPSATGMSGMDPSSGMDGMKCNMQMVWNWDTIDGCFIAESWFITSRGMFAGSCIGVVFFVVALEFLRRFQREYDRLIVRQWKERAASGSIKPTTMNEKMGTQISAKLAGALGSRPLGGLAVSESFSPTLLQHAVRSVLYSIQVGATYLLMLIAMSFNGYIIICIILGALIGYFFFGSDNIVDGLHQETGVSCC